MSAKAQMSQRTDPFRHGSVTKQSRVNAMVRYAARHKAPRDTLVAIAMRQVSKAFVYNFGWRKQVAA